MAKYPDYVMRNVRQAMGLDDKNDTSRDAEIESMSKTNVLDLHLQWNGLIGFGSSIRETVKDVWGVDLEE